MKTSPEITLSEIKGYIEKFPKAKIGICGDFYLDRYIVGIMNGISREAPVPIIRTSTDDYSPGGGGNIALNLGSLKTQGYCIGPVGNDISGEITIQKYKEAGLNTDLTWKVDYRKTPTFNKIYASSYFGKVQQVARFDQENETPLNSADQDKLIANIKTAFEVCDFIIFADYGEVENTGIITKDVLKAIEGLTLEYDTKILANSRLNIKDFRGFDYLIVNDYEACAAAGLVSIGSSEPIEMDLIYKAGEIMLNNTNSQKALITLGAKGILIADRSGAFEMVPSVEASGDIDVTGAGDTTMAAIAATICAGGSDGEACHLGNLAAGTTVKKLNTTGWATEDDILGEFALRQGGSE